MIVNCQGGQPSFALSHQPSVPHPYLVILSQAAGKVWQEAQRK